MVHASSRTRIPSGISTLLLSCVLGLLLGCSPGAQLSEGLVSDAGIEERNGSGFRLPPWCDNPADCASHPIRIYGKLNADCRSAISEHDILCVRFILESQQSPGYAPLRVKLPMSADFVEFDNLYYPNRYLNQVKGAAVFMVKNKQRVDASSIFCQNHEADAKISWRWPRLPTERLSDLLMLVNAMGDTFYSLKPDAMVRLNIRVNKPDTGPMPDMGPDVDVPPPPSANLVQQTCEKDVCTRDYDWRFCEQQQLDVRLNAKLPPSPPAPTSPQPPPEPKVTSRVLWSSDLECTKVLPKAIAHNPQLDLSLGLKGMNPRYLDLCAFFYLGTCAPDSSKQTCPRTCEQVTIDGQRETCVLDENGHTSDPGRCNPVGTMAVLQESVTIESSGLTVEDSSKCTTSPCTIRVRSKGLVLPGSAGYKITIEGTIEPQGMYFGGLGIGCGCGRGPGAANMDTMSQILIGPSGGSQIQASLNKPFTIKTMVVSRQDECNRFDLSLITNNLPQGAMVKISRVILEK